MAYNNPSVADFKARFARDFKYGTDLTTVRDEDIAQAFVQTNTGLPVQLFGGQAQYTNGYLLMSAYYLVENLKMSGGLSNGAFTFFQTSKSVGSVSASYGVPQKMLDNPYFAMLCRNPYGAQYLMAIYPYLNGQMFLVAGGTTP